MDSCYLCEIGKDGIVVPFRNRDILVCTECLLGCIYAHPKLSIFLEKAS